MNDAVEDHVATVTINNPPMNALTGAVMAELESVIDRIAKDPEIKTVVITGGHVEGADIREIAAISSGKTGAR